VSDLLTLSIESGVTGGIPAQHGDFGLSYNAEAIIEQSSQFDFYDGGGLDMSFLGLAQSDARGNVNVSKFNGRPVGCGGFVNITRSTRKLVFCGSFTAGGFEATVGDGRLRIDREGTLRKFVRDVEQVTFNGAYAAETGKQVLYVTERCVFKRTAEGLELAEIAPGIDLQRDILDQMGFKPIVRDPKPMDPHIFAEEPMQLEEALLGLGLAQRASYDAERNTLFLNLEGMRIRTRDDVDRVRRVVEERCQAIGRKVALIVNYDDVTIEPAVADTYAAMVRYMEMHYYTTSTRYSTSAFLRLKLGEALSRRKVAAHIFETSEEAHAFVERESTK